MLRSIAISLIACGFAAAGEFRDRTADLVPELGGSKACWADFDRDGWTDLCVGGVVWKNEKGKKFSKLTHGVADAVAADFDNDGWGDLCSWPSRVLRNREGKEFERINLPELPNCISQSACWADVNGDAFVDVYVAGFENWEAGITYPSYFLINDTGRAFQLGAQDARYRARGATACDFDRDADVDIYVSNYRLQPNLLWINDGKGKFKDKAAELNAVATSPGFAGGHSIGAAWGDFDNDGLFDLFAGNFAHVDGRGDQPKSRFLRNLGPEKMHIFDDRGPCGVFYQESYASPAAGDYDNDGDLDLFFTTVYGVASFDVKNNPVLFRNDGDFKFTDVTAEAKLNGLPPTYQAAWSDFDQDGDLDLVTANKLFENTGTQGHWLRVVLEGDGKLVNRSAIGSQVRVRLNDHTLSRQVEAGTGEGNQNDLALHFGLGEHAEPVRLEIFWPNGTEQIIEAAVVDRTHAITFTRK